MRWTGVADHGLACGTTSQLVSARIHLSWDMLHEVAAIQMCGAVAASRK